MGVYLSNDSDFTGLASNLNLIAQYRRPPNGFDLLIYLVTDSGVGDTCFQSRFLIEPTGCRLPVACVKNARKTIVRSHRRDVELNRFSLGLH